MLPAKCLNPENFQGLNPAVELKVLQIMKLKSFDWKLEGLKKNWKPNILAFSQYLSSFTKIFRENHSPWNVVVFKGTYARVWTRREYRRCSIKFKSARGLSQVGSSIGWGQQRIMVFCDALHHFKWLHHFTHCGSLVCFGSNTGCSNSANTYKIFFRILSPETWINNLFQPILISKDWPSLKGKMDFTTQCKSFRV